MGFELKCDVFNHEDYIPDKYTCKGEDISPPLSWTEPPAGTKSFALINDDPDAPMGTWVHWVIYDLPADLRKLPEAMPKSQSLDDGAKQGVTDFGCVGYGGPCPPPGKPHRYYFKLYALDTLPGLPAGLSKKDLENRMKGHIIGQAEIMGYYKR